MKFLASLLLLVGAAAAQSNNLADYLPKCSVDCLAQGVASATPCKPNDLKCLCIADYYRATYTASVGCVLQACGQDVAIGEVLPAAAKMCEIVLSSTYSTPGATAVSSAAAPATSVLASTTAASSSSSAVAGSSTTGGGPASSTVTAASSTLASVNGTSSTSAAPQSTVSRAGAVGAAGANAAGGLVALLFAFVA